LGVQPVQERIHVDQDLTVRQVEARTDSVRRAEAVV
jgi:hypothetical protein